MMLADALPTLLAAWAAFVAAAISPGPNMVAVASRALGAARASALAVAAGIALGTLERISPSGMDRGPLLTHDAVHGPAAARR